MIYMSNKGVNILNNRNSINKFKMSKYELLVEFS